jgi:hypothetical protein
MPRPTTRSRTRAEDDYEDEPRSPRRDDDEDNDRGDRSRRTTRRRSQDEDEHPRRGTFRSRSRGEDSDDRESRRASRSEGAKEATSTTLGRGREGLRRHAETHQGGDFPDRFKVGDDEVLVKLLDEDFIITYYQHEFFDDFKGEKRQKTFVCLGDDCPLCDIGDSPRFYALINVVNLANPSKPKLELWYATPNPGGLLGDEMDALEERDKKINDPAFYYVVSKKKQKNNFYSYSLKQVKSRDLEEDGYGIPLTDAELAEFIDKAWDEDVVRINPRKELREIADELSDD